MQGDVIAQADNLGTNAAHGVRWLEDGFNRQLAELLDRVGSRDTTAFRQLYDFIAPQLFSVLLRMLRDRELAQDALQDVFVNIWRKAANYRPERGFAVGWLTSIARYRALDLLRQQKRRRTYEAPAAEEYALEATEEAAHDDLQFRTGAQRLRKCMDELNDGPRNSIRLAYIAGCTHEEIAVSLETPLGTVKSWIRRGLLALKQCMER